jgi:hypothetical protein
MYHFSTQFASNLTITQFDNLNSPACERKTGMISQTEQALEPINSGVLTKVTTTSVLPPPQLQGCSTSPLVMHSCESDGHNTERQAASVLIQNQSETNVGEQINQRGRSQ